MRRVSFYNFSRPPVNSVAQLSDIGFWARAGPGTARQDVGWFWHGGSQFLIFLAQVKPAQTAQVAHFSLCTEMKEVQLDTMTIRQLPITNKGQRLEPLEPPGVPEPAQMSLVWVIL